MAEKVKITFLGTGSAIPTARRNHPSILLRYKDENILVDCGEGTQRQFRKARLNPCKITKLLISHWHADHVLGIPGLLQTLMLNGYNRKLEIYGPRGTREKMRKYMDLFVKKGDKLDLAVHEVSNKIFFDNGEFLLETKPLDHDAPMNGYSFNIKEKNRLDKEKLKKLKISNSPAVGQLALGKTVEINGKKVDGKKLLYKEKSRKVAVVMDTRMCKNAVEIAKGSDVLICESSYSKEESEVAADHAHMTSHDAASIAKKAKVGKLFLIHLSQRYEGIPKILEKEAKEIFKDVKIPEDLDSVEV